MKQLILDEFKVPHKTWLIKWQNVWVASHHFWIINVATVGETKLVGLGVFSENGIYLSQLVFQLKIFTYVFEILT